MTQTPDDDAKSRFAEVRAEALVPELRDDPEVSDRAPTRSSVELFASDASRDEFVRLLASAVSLVLASGDLDSLEDLSDDLADVDRSIDGLSGAVYVCSNFSSGPAGSIDFEQEEDLDL